MTAIRWFYLVLSFVAAFMCGVRTEKGEWEWVVINAIVSCVCFYLLLRAETGPTEPKPLKKS